jgi:hypothetical protein
MKKEFTIDYLTQRISSLEDRYARYFIQNRRKHLFVVKGTLDNYKQLLKQLLEQEKAKTNEELEAETNTQAQRKISKEVNKRSPSSVPVSGMRTLAI